MLFLDSWPSLMVDFFPVESWNTCTAVGLFGAGVIGMQVRQVARKPLECFVNGQLCLSTSEPILHSKVWHHAKLPPNHSCVMCFFFLKRTLYSAPIWEHKFLCFVHYCLLWFPSWLMATFPADRIRPRCASQCLLWLLYNGRSEKQRGPSLSREFALMTWKERELQSRSRAGLRHASRVATG